MFLTRALKRLPKIQPFVVNSLPLKSNYNALLSINASRKPKMFFSTNETEKKSNPIVHLKTAEDWEQKIINSNKPVVLDFYADWCGPCKKLTPMLEQRYNNSNGEWLFAKCNVDEFQELAQAFNVSSIPAVFLIHNGNVEDSFLGALPDKELDKFIEKAVSLTKK